MTRVTSRLVDLSVLSADHLNQYRSVCLNCYTESRVLVFIAFSIRFTVRDCSSSHLVTSSISPQVQLGVKVWLGLGSVGVVTEPNPN